MRRSQMLISTRSIMLSVKITILTITPTFNSFVLRLTGNLVKTVTKLNFELTTPTLFLFFSPTVGTRRLFLNLSFQSMEAKAEQSKNTNLTSSVCFTMLVSKAIG